MESRNWARFNLWMVLLIVSLLPSCRRDMTTGSSELASQRQQEIESVRSALRAVLTAMNRGKPQEMSEWIDSQFVSMSPGSQALGGRERFLEAMSSMLERLQAQTSYTSDELEVSGEWAFSRGRFSRTLTSKTDGTTSAQMGKAVLIFRKVEGRWLLYAHIWNLSQ